MFKKLRQRIYNKKTREKLLGVAFDDFAFCLDCEYPMFIVTATETKNYSFFVPQTEEMFKLAFDKLQNNFFKEIDLDEIKYRVKVFCNYYNFSSNTFDYCVNKIEVKSKNYRNYVNNNL